MTPTITWEQFEQIDFRAGTIISAEVFPEARKPAYKLVIDLGPEIGHKRSSAQITTFYTPEELIGKQVVYVVNFPPMKVGPFVSEVLTTGFVLENNGGCVVTTLERTVPNGTKLS